MIIVLLLLTSSILLLLPPAHSFAICPAVIKARFIGSPLSTLPKGIRSLCLEKNNKQHDHHQHCTQSALEVEGTLLRAGRSLAGL